MTTLIALKIPVGPVNPVVPKGVPPSKRVIPLIPVELDPEFVIVRLVNVTGDVPRLFTRIWTTGKLVVPGNWVELEGEEGPLVTNTVTEVGVKVTVDEGMAVVVLVIVLVAVFVAVLVGELVDVFGGVFVVVLVGMVVRVGELVAV